MLIEEVVEAVHENLFNVYAVQTIDEAIAVLTGRTAGARGKDGEFPPDTLNRLVEDKLVQYASKRKQFSEGGSDDKAHK
jgi:hypothetical protein